MFINSLFTILIPVMASSAGEGGVIACRVIQGLNQGFLFPSVHTLLGKWTPLPERSKVVSFVYTGGPLGIVISLPVTGVIANSSTGWPTAFYLYGGLGIGWSVLWALLGADSPAKHGRISDEEREYIKGGGNTSDEDKKELPTPWLSIATSMPFIAIFVTHCGQNWGFWTLMTEIPSYMSDIMKYDIKDVSLRLCPSSFTNSCLHPTEQSPLSLALLRLVDPELLLQSFGRLSYRQALPFDRKREENLQQYR
jgi:MFS family permease